MPSRARSTIGSSAGSRSRPALLRRFMPASAPDHGDDAATAGGSSSRSADRGRACCGRTRARPSAGRWWPRRRSGELERARPPRVAADRGAEPRRRAHRGRRSPPLQARRLARPLEAIARRSAQLGDGDFSIRAGHFGVPEIDAIAQGLDSQRRPDRRARRARARVLGQRLASAADPADGAAAAHRGGGAARSIRAMRARASSTPRWPRPTGSRRRSRDLLAHARQASAGATITVNLGERRARSRRQRWRPVFAALRARARGGRRTRTCSCGPRAGPSARCSTCCSTTRFAMAAGAARDRGVARRRVARASP